jgi:hypothetical protein
MLVDPFLWQHKGNALRGVLIYKRLSNS